MNTTATALNGTAVGSRSQIVDRARLQWIAKLIDLSRRNNLLYFRVLKTGTLDFSGAPPEHIARLLSGESVAISKLLPLEKDDAATVVREIARRSLSNLEEKGLHTLFVAVGMATWPAEDQGRPAEAPLILVPISVTASGRSIDTFSIARDGNVQVNLVLLQVLENYYGVHASAEELLPLLLGNDEGEAFDPQPLFTAVTERVGDKIKEFHIRPSVFLGNFAFQKMAMVKDLQERGAELAAHDLIAAMSGDPGARASVGTSTTSVDPKELDRTSPDNEFLVLDADSSQQAAIATIVKGESAVVHGPPGTGKSQTIVNLIASLTAAGKRVLFVAEKRAALEVVHRRLKDVGLDHLAIDFHGADVAPKRVMEQVGRALEKVRESIPVDCATIHDCVVDRRDRLNAHVARLHESRPPAGKSVFQLQGLCLRLGQTAPTKTRWRGADLSRLTPNQLTKARDLLKEATGFAALFLRTDASPWCGAKLPDGASVQRALDLVNTLQDTLLPAFLASTDRVLRSIGASGIATLKELRDLLALNDEVQTTLANYSEDVFRSNPEALALQLAPGMGSFVNLAWAWMTNPEFRRARTAVLEMRSAEKVNIATLHRDMAATGDQLVRWQKQGLSELPTTIAEYGVIQKTCTSFWPVFDELNSVLGRNLNDCTTDELVGMVRLLAADTKTPRVMPKLTGVENGLNAIGVRALVSELRASHPVVDRWTEMLDLAWYSSTLEAAFETDAELAGFSGATHNGFVSEFADNDEQRIEIAAARVRHAHAGRAVAAMNTNRDQQMLIKAEAQKTRRHLPLRRLFAQASDVLTAICPCWMASPLSVSQLLDGGKRYFDYVIFDEASQVLPEDAVCAILRGDRLVVAGDRNQLPPTTFFAAATEDELVLQEESDASDGYESLLDLMNGFLPSKYLNWHYRSKDEALIAFSNHFIYGDRLVTFPGPGGPAVISHVHVKQPSGMDGQEESCAAEVQRVVGVVIEHANKRPDETLGIITMGIRHRDRIQRAIDNALENHPELDLFFDQNRHERFFVKNLEAVQGDERDAIVISVGYGKDRAGNLPFRFGPLLPEGGRRRLNVAVTRARKRVTLVSSFNHLDMDMARVRPGSGVEMLRHYLEYASSHGRLVGTSYLTAVALNDFEQDICDALSSRGLKLIPQLGASQFRIDLVAEHPEKPGRYVLAIECDGATYHSSYTARDRDRLRQRQLEALGWKFHRIWSTDWFMRKTEEIERAVQAFTTAVAYADQLDAALPRVTGNDSHRQPAAPMTNGRSAKPYFVPGQPITTYSHWRLVEIVQWLASDGFMRTDEELLREAVEELGFRRRGTRIDNALTEAIQEWRRTTNKR